MGRDTCAWGYYDDCTWGYYDDCTWGYYDDCTWSCYDVRQYAWGDYDVRHDLRVWACLSDVLIYSESVG